MLIRRQSALINHARGIVEATVEGLPECSAKVCRRKADEADDGVCRVCGDRRGPTPVGGDGAGGRNASIGVGELLERREVLGRHRVQLRRGISHRDYARDETAGRMPGPGARTVKRRFDASVFGPGEGQSSWTGGGLPANQEAVSVGTECLTDEEETALRDHGGVSRIPGDSDYPELVCAVLVLDQIGDSGAVRRVADRRDGSGRLRERGLTRLPARGRPPGLDECARSRAPVR